MLDVSATPPLSWQLAFAFSVLVLVWATTSVPTRAPRAWPAIWAYQSAWLAISLAGVAHALDVAASVTAALCAAGAAAAAVVIREARCWIAQRDDEDDDDGRDDEDGNGGGGDDGPSGGLDIDWDAFERDVHDAWVAHRDCVLVA